MKNILLHTTVLVMLMLVGGTRLTAQGPHHDTYGGGNHQGGGIPEEKIKALKVAFLASRLNLSTAEAQVFWPVYNAYQDAKMEVHRAQLKLAKTLATKFDVLTEAEMNKMLDEHISLKQKESNLEIENLQKLRTILPVKKIALLQKAERDFKIEVLREYKNRGRGGPVPGSDH
jgi:hypothetical protein